MTSHRDYSNLLSREALHIFTGGSTELCDSAQLTHSLTFPAVTNSVTQKERGLPSGAPRKMTSLLCQKSELAAGELESLRKLPLHQHARGERRQGDVSHPLIGSIRDGTAAKPIKELSSSHPPPHPSSPHSFPSAFTSSCSPPPHRTPSPLSDLALGSVMQLMSLSLSAAGTRSHSELKVGRSGVGGGGPGALGGGGSTVKNNSQFYQR